MVQGPGLIEGGINISWTKRQPSPRPSQVPTLATQSFCPHWHSHYSTLCTAQLFLRWGCIRVRQPDFRVPGRLSLIVWFCAAKRTIPTCWSRDVGLCVKGCGLSSSLNFPNKSAAPAAGHSYVRAARADAGTPSVHRLALALPVASLHILVLRPTALLGCARLDAALHLFVGHQAHDNLQAARVGTYRQDVANSRRKLTS